MVTASAERLASDEGLQIEGMELAPGTRATRRLPVVEMADGTWVELPVMVVRGARRGPVLYLGGGVHGDEVNSVAIVSRVARELDPAALAGTLIAVPVQSPLAFRIQHRLAIGQYVKSPMDQSPIDVFHSFPGDPGGNLAAIIAHALWDRFMAKAAFVLDVHTPTTGGRYAPFTFLPPTRCGAVVERAETLARAFGADFILANDKGMYVGDKNPHVVAAEHGKVAFGIELGEGGRLEDEEIERGVRGLTNVFKAVGMLAGAPERIGRQMVIRTMTVIRVTRGGVLRLSVRLNDEVAKGQTVATVTDVFGDVVEEVTAPHAGPVVRVTTFPSVSTGERVVQLGVAR